MFNNFCFQSMHHTYRLITHLLLIYIVYHHLINNAKCRETHLTAANTDTFMFHHCIYTYIKELYFVFEVLANSLSLLTPFIHEFIFFFLLETTPYIWTVGQQKPFKGFFSFLFIFLFFSFLFVRHYPHPSPT